MSYKLIYLARRAKTVEREDWPRTWKSHAIFASKFPVLEAEIRWLRYCNRIDQPMLDGKPVDLPFLSTGHDGVAVAASPTLEGISGAGFTPEDREKIDEDERRVFDMLTPNFTFFTTETAVKEGELGEAAVFSFHARKPGMTREQFDERYHGEHADIARDTVGSLAGLTRYMLNRPVQEPLPLFPFDGITEGWYETESDAIRALTGSDLDPVRRDLGLFCDLGAGVIMLTRPCHSWSQP
jgi:hypothetical protein